MATASRTYDVFISHSASDRDVVGEIADSLQAAGLETFHAGLVKPGADVGQAIWEALAESRAVIAIISPSASPHAMGMVEIGAAAAWNKPVYLVINGPSSTKLPPPLGSYPVYPLARLDEIIEQIRSGFEPLTVSQRTILADIYRELQTPTDQLSVSPGVLRELTTQFNRSAGQQFSGERILSELYRMRKKGQLPRLRTRV